jgi:hypothetical protein
MTRATVLSIVIGAATFFCAAPGGAQTPAWTDRGYLVIRGAVQAPPGSVSSITHPIDFAEASIVDTTYKGSVAPSIDGGVGIRVWRNLAVGAELSWMSKAGSASVNAQVPNPFLFGRLRPVSGDASGLAHSEVALHIQARWVVPASRGRRWQVDLFGGPSLFQLNQDVVQDVTITDAYPFDTATYAGVARTGQSKTVLGFHAGTDVTRLVTKRVALGFNVGYSHGSAALRTADGSTLPVNVGGFQAGASLRVAFPQSVKGSGRAPKAAPPRKR